MIDIDCLILARFHSSLSLYLSLRFTGRDIVHLFSGLDSYLRRSL